MMRKWPLGSIISLSSLIQGKWSEYAEMGLDTCQVNGLPLNGEASPEALKILAETASRLPMLSATLGWEGPAVWDFLHGPQTLGIVPADKRENRMQQLKRQMKMVAECGLKLVNTHIGFIPENPGDPAYPGVIESLQELGEWAGTVGVVFCLETGQETPVALKRAILDSGSPNLGINLDPANLLMYGKANPVDAAGVFGELVKSVHIKDGEYPTGSMRLLGHEKPVGEGLVDFSGLLSVLCQKGFSGPLIIEREISGPEQQADIRKAIRVIDHIVL